MGELEVCRVCRQPIDGHIYLVVSGENPWRKREPVASHAFVSTSVMVGRRVVEKRMIKVREMIERRLRLRLARDGAGL